MKYVTALLSLSLFVACFPSSARAQTSTIVLVQRANKDAGTATSATLAFNSNNTAGNWIGVCVRAGHSGQIFTVTDSQGNTYRRAAQYNVTVDTPNGHTLGIFYAENIAGGANAITVSDTISGTMRIAIVEYSGVAATNSLDVFAVAQGNGVSPNSGNATTTSSGELLLGAISSAYSASFTAGNGFAIEGSVPAAPNTKLIAEDRIQMAAGTVSAGAVLAAPDNWGVTLAAFKPGNAWGSSPPSITSLNPTSGVLGTSVAITGANFGATQGTSTLTLNGTAGTPTSWSATSIVAPAPAGATTANVVVTVGGVASNGMNFTVTPPPPSITSLNPTSGVVGTSVTVSGANFGATQGASTITFNGTAGTPASWSATSIVVPVPSGAVTGNVVVTRAPSGGGSAGDISNGVNFIDLIRSEHHEFESDIGRGRYISDDCRRELWDDARNKHGHLQWDIGDTDELECDEHRRPRAAGDNDRECAGDSWRSSKQRSELLCPSGNAWNRAGPACKPGRRDNNHCVDCV